MQDQDFLKQALLIAEYSPEEIRCGAVIVLDGEVVAKAFNSQTADHITTHHAEIKVLELANKALVNQTLAGAIMYCSCEPCPMCLTALSFAKVSRIVYAHTMLELWPGDKVSRIDSASFAKQLDHVPELVQIALAS